MGKSSLFGVGIRYDEVTKMARVVRCKAGALPFKHLGIPVGENMNRVVSWSFLFDIFESRLASWKGACLSMAGRITLIKSVLESLPAYYFSMFKAPGSVIEGLEKIMKNFLWGGSSNTKKIHWVSWDYVTSPTSVGGLGISKLKDVNLALLTKWIWRFRVDVKGIWRKAIMALHDNKRTWCSVPASKNFKGELGDGKTIRFWLDPWLTDRQLKDDFPRLFKLEKSKKCLVYERYDTNTQGFGRWDWYLRPESNEEIEEHGKLMRLLDGVRLRDVIDRWQWLGNPSKEFSVKEAKRFLSKDDDYSNRYVFGWSKWTPKKCNLLMWRAVMDRVPTLKALQMRNCTYGNLECSLCNEGDETIEHILCSCKIANEVWQYISSWCKVKPMVIFSVKDLTEIHKYIGLGKRESKVFKGIVFVACWCIWKARNEARFERIKACPKKIKHDILALGFLWLKNRGKYHSLVWKEWCKFAI